MNNVTDNTTSSNLVHSTQEKLAEWEEKSKKCPRELALKVAALVLLIFSSLALLLATALLAPSAGVFLAGFSVGMCGCEIGLNLLPFLIDWTNFKKPENVIWVLKEIKNAKKPLSLSYIKRLNRYGIVSDQELKKREDLEDKVKKYKTLTNTKGIRKLNNEISRKTIELKKFKNLEAFKERTKSIEDKIKGLNVELKEKKQKLDEIETGFKNFHQNIVTFDPYTSLSAGLKHPFF